MIVEEKQKLKIFIVIFMGIIPFVFGAIGLCIESEGAKTVFDPRLAFLFGFIGIITSIVYYKIANNHNIKCKRVFLNFLEAVNLLIFDLGILCGSTDEIFPASILLIFFAHMSYLTSPENK